MSIIRFYAFYDKNAQLDEFFGTIIKLSLIFIVILASVFVVLLFFCKEFFSKELYSLMLLGSLVFSIAAFFGILQDVLRAKRLAGWYSFFSIWESIASFGLGLCLILIFQQSIEGLLWGAIVGVAIILPVILKISIGKFLKSIMKIRGISIIFTLEMLKYGIPLVVGNLGFWILNLSDRYILNLFHSAYEVGIYSVSYSVSSNSIMLLTSLFLITSGPLSMNIWEKKGEKESQEFVNKLTRYYLIICIPSVVGLTSLAKPILTILADSEYQEGYKIIGFVTAGVFFFGLQQRYQTGLLLHKKTYLIMHGILAAGFLNLALNFLLVPEYGYMAAAVTTLLSFIFLLVVMIIFSQRFFVWKFPFTTLIKTCCASLVMGVIVYQIASELTSSALVNTMVGLITGTLIYLFLLYLFREFTQEEIEALGSLKQKIIM